MQSVHLVMFQMRTKTKISEFSNVRDKLEPTNLGRDKHDFRLVVPHSMKQRTARTQQIRSNRVNGEMSSR